MSVNSSLDVLFKQQDKKDEIHFGFIKQVLLMASGLLGILVSLHQSTNSNDNDSTRMAFRFAIGLLALGILFLTIALFSQVAQHKETFRKWKEEVLLQFHDSEYDPKLVVGEVSKLYVFFEKCGYSSLILSLIFITIYAILIA